MVKQKFHLILFLVAFTLISFTANNKGNTIYFKGKVTCNGEGIEGVAVTDGVAVVLTDKNGKYSFSGKPDTRFVYISKPSGYKISVKKSVPQFYFELPPDKKKHIVNFPLEKISGDDARHGFVVWADPQVKTEKEVLLAKEVANDLINLLGNYPPDIQFHGLGCGDIIGDNPVLFDRIKDILEPTEIPFYQSMGNHDMLYNNRSNYLAPGVYQSHFGPDYYSFNRGEIHYVVLNNVFYIGRDYFYIGYLTEKQLSWLENDLSAVKEGSTIVLTMHIPTALDEQDLNQFSYSAIAQATTNKMALYKILEPYNTHIITGHLHMNNNLEIASNIFEHNISAVCGAWWQGDYAEDGTPKGYAVFEVNGSELQWYYKSFGYDREYQFRAYKAGENVEQPEYITANVWNWDSEWKVYWYENGKRIGEMEAYSGTDPETVKAYSDKESLDYKWISARKTQHMFRAKPKSLSAKITIEVIDRFGHSYKKTLQ